MEPDIKTESLKKGDKVKIGQDGMEVKPLDSFENTIVDVALKLLDEKIDPETAAMDILDAVNEKKLTEDIQRRAGIIEGKPNEDAIYIRAYDILREHVGPETATNVMAMVEAGRDLGQVVQELEANLNFLRQISGELPEEANDSVLNAYASVGRLRRMLRV